MSLRTYLDPAGQERVVKVREDRLLVDVKNPNEAGVTHRDRDFNRF